KFINELVRDKEVDFMEKLMEYFLLGSFLLYLVSSVMFVLGISGKETSSEKNKERTEIWGKRGITVAIIGACFQVLFIVTRIFIGGHFPTSNLFEFTAFLCFAI